jgi:hypothetical protein
VLVLASEIIFANCRPDVGEGFERFPFGMQGFPRHPTKLIFAERVARLDRVVDQNEVRPSAGRHAADRCLRNPPRAVISSWARLALK